MSEHRAPQTADVLLLRGRWIARTAVYGATLVLASIQIGYQAADAVDPRWLTVATAVVTFYAGVLGLGNVTRRGDAPEPPAP